MAYVGRSPGVAVWAVVLEVQGEPDEDKHWSIPVYGSVLRARLKCEASVLMVCLLQRTAAWGEQPIVMDSRGWVLRPVVLGPRQAVELVESGVIDGDRPPTGLTVLLAMFLADHDVHGERVRRALLRVIFADPDHPQWRYLDLVLGVRPAVKTKLEATMTATMADFGKPYYSVPFREAYGAGLADGEARGRVEEGAEALITILQGRGLALDAAARTRISSCTDPGRLLTWIRRAVDADSVTDILDDQG